MDSWVVIVYPGIRILCNLSFLIFFKNLPIWKTAYLYKIIVRKGVKAPRKERTYMYEKRMMRNKLLVWYFVFIFEHEQLLFLFLYFAATASRATRARFVASELYDASARVRKTNLSFGELRAK